MSDTNKPQGSNPDPEMIKNLDLLLNLDVLEHEEDWEMLELIQQPEIELEENNE